MDEVDRLPEDSVDDVVDGLTGCSFSDLSKVFESFKTNRKSESLGSDIALTGSTLESTILCRNNRPLPKPISTTLLRAPATTAVATVLVVGANVPSLGTWLASTSRELRKSM